MKTLLITIFGAVALMFAVTGCNCCPCKAECPDAKNNGCVAIQAESGCMNKCTQATATECCKAQCPNGKCCKSVDK